MKKIMILMVVVLGVAVNAANTMSTVELAVEWLKQAENYSAHTYVDAGGKLAVGYGSHDSRWVMDGFIDGYNAEELLRREVVGINNWLIINQGIHLTRCKQVAIISLVYNIGRGAFDRSTVKQLLINKLYGKNLVTEWSEFNHSEGKVNVGLTKRRKMELELFRRKD